MLFFVAAGCWYCFSVFSVEQGIEEVSGSKPNGTVAESDADGLAGTQDAVPTEPPKVMYCVFLCGCVQNEGVYELPEGARLYEALALAGGYTKEADTAWHNLARVISDGERIYIPSTEETKESSLEEKLESPAAEYGQADKEQTEKVNLNTADAEKLMTLPGIEQAKAESILEYRTKVGEFASVEEVMNISGIGEAMFEKMKEYITVE